MVVTLDLHLWSRTLKIGTVLSDVHLCLEGLYQGALFLGIRLHLPLPLLHETAAQCGRQPTCCSKFFVCPPQLFHLLPLCFQLLHLPCRHRLL